MTYQYDKQNIFAKILRDEIPNKTVLNTDHTLAFHDMYPQAPHHIIVIPKGAYICFDHFIKFATDAEILDWNKAIITICDMVGISTDTGDGYRLIINSGPNGNQEVPHLHVHILAGRNLASILPK